VRVLADPDAGRERGAHGAPGHFRTLVYANEMVGLGHLRRAIAITGGLAEGYPGATSLILTGSPIESYVHLPPRVDTVKLPVVSRAEDGTPRSPRLVVDLDELHKLRSAISFAAATSFDPHLLLVDKVPLGLRGELEPTLAALRARGTTQLVLGVRDVEDDPETVSRRWDGAVRRAIERYYDAIVVYGPPGTPDAITSTGWANLSVPVVRVGYVGVDVPYGVPDDLPSGYMLATAGGGSDGFPMLETFVEAIRLRPLPCPSVMVVGPLMSHREAEHLRELSRGLDITIFGFRSDMEQVVAGARALVSMAGYNTVTELMRARKPALLVPRVHPSQEQLIRATALAERGLQDMMHPRDLNPAAMRAALDRLLTRPAPNPEADEYSGTQRAVKALVHLAAIAIERRRTVSLRPAGRAGELEEGDGAVPGPILLDRYVAGPAGHRPSNGKGRRQGGIALVTSGFPRVSETFLLNELAALRAAGLLTAVFSTKPGDNGLRQPAVEELADVVELLPPGTPAEQGRVLTARLRESDVSAVHAYFAHEPAAVALEAARRMGVPFGFSAHARDIRKAGDRLTALAAAATCVVACNSDVAADLARAGRRAELVPHGVDLSRFSPQPLPPDGPLRLLAVGRLVPKKGFDVLLDAISRLTVPLLLRIVGDGPEREALELVIDERHLRDRVTLVGHATHADLPREYAAAHLVVVPSVVDGGGDRDGLPNVVLEAMASARPVVGSAVGALPSAVVDGVTGVLVPPADAAALAAALAELAARKDRQRMGAAGRDVVERQFSLEDCAARLARVLGAAYG
jgi:predicted glycosyltransferase/glycosyltransferase involved in cell wall biosynthesis